MFMSPPQSEVPDLRRAAEPRFLRARLLNAHLPFALDTTRSESHPTPAGRVLREVMQLARSGRLMSDDHFNRRRLHAHRGLGIAQELPAESVAVHGRNVGVGSSPHYRQHSIGIYSVSFYR
jgi:hypothetical protein